MLSQLKTRGALNGSDEWVEIYNPTSTSVAFDATWSVQVMNASSGCASGYATRFTGGNQTIPPHGHILYANTGGYSEMATTPADGTYGTGIADAGSVILVHGSTVVDALCFYYDTTTEATLTGTGCAVPYTCSGTPVKNPHDNTSATDNNESLERKPGGSGGNTVDTGDNANDFQVTNPADPHDLASTPVP